MTDAPGSPARPVLSPAAQAAVRPDAPVEARLKAARGDAELPPADGLAAMAVLAADADPAVRQAARDRLSKGPVGSLLEGVTPDTDPRILDILARARGADPQVADRLLRHPGVPDSALARLAAAAPERLATAVQDRALPRQHRARIAQAMHGVSDAPGAPEGGNLRGAAEAQAPSPAAAGAQAPSQGAAEASPPSQEAPAPAPTDPQRLPATQDPSASPAASLAAVEALEAELDEQFEFDRLLTDEIDDDMPEAAEKKESLYKQILGMTMSQKIQLASKGNKEARGILVKDPNKLVCCAVVKSPKVSEIEVVAYAHSRSVSPDVFREIARNNDYVKVYKVRLALASNPRTPVDIALHCLSSLNESDVAALAKSRNVSSTVQAAARRVVQAKAEKELRKQRQLFGDG